MANRDGWDDGGMVCMMGWTYSVSGGGLFLNMQSVRACGLLRRYDFSSFGLLIHIGRLGYIFCLYHVQSDNASPSAAIHVWFVVLHVEFALPLCLTPRLLLDSVYT